MRSYKSLFAAVAVTFIAAQAAVAAPASDFELVDSYGNHHRLADYRGRHLVLEWLNHDCPFVVKHYNSGNMQALQKRFTADGVVWLSVVSSAPGKQGNFPPAQMNHLTDSKGAAPTAVLRDESGDVGRAYGARTTPHMYVIDPAGELVYQGAIDDKPSTRLEDVPGATNYVVAALQASFAGKPVDPALTQPYGCSVKY